MATRSFSSIHAGTTAVRASSYRPPSGTRSYDAPTATSTVLAPLSEPTTPVFTDDYYWVKSYLMIHKMSTPSYRYSFIFWICLVFFVLIFAVLHWTGSRGGFVGAAWSKWSLRRRTWRKKHTLAQARKDGMPHKQPFSLPSNAQILSLIFLFAIPLALCLFGPDYIAPDTKLWDLVNNMSTPNLQRRNEFEQFDAFEEHAKGLLDKRVKYFTSSTQNPEYTIPKAWWTQGGRWGIMAFALFPLVTLFSLKAPPFAVFAIPFLIQIHFDKLARLHRWTGRLIWFVTTVHVVTWGIQLGRDKRGTGSRTKSHWVAWNFVWQYPLFIEGCIAYVALTALVVLSVGPFRTKYYELFYLLHILLVPVTLIFSALHFPQIWWWCWAALILWIGERIYRLVRWVYINGLWGKWKVESTAPRTGPLGSYGVEKKAAFGNQDKSQAWEMGVRLAEPKRDPNAGTPQFEKPERLALPREYSSSTWQSDDETYRPSMRPSDGKRVSDGTEGTNVEFSPVSPITALPNSAKPLQEGVISPVYPPIGGPRVTKMPPPGYAYCQLLPGRVIRLRLLTARPMTWAPGQHVLLYVPYVSKFTTHPFTISGCYDGESPTGEGRVIELIVRAKAGFTKDLWDSVCRLISAGNSPYPFASNPDPESLGAQKLNNGVLMRAFVDGPFGTSIRAHWANYSTVLIVTGGTGVTYGASILEYLCHCLSGRDGQTLGGRPGGWGSKGFRTTRVRFVWLVREFSHIQWCASLIRRCTELVPSSALQIDIFVSNFEANRISSDHNATLFRNRESMIGADNMLAPPAPQFMGRPRSMSNTSADSNVSLDTSADLTYAQGAGSNIDITHSQELGHEEHILDYTNFDGEDDTRAPGEANLNQRVRKEGHIRRAKSRKKAAAAVAKHELEQKVNESRGPSYKHHAPPALPMESLGYNGGRRVGFPPSPGSPPQELPTPHSAADAYRTGGGELLNPSEAERNNRWSVQSFQSLGRALSPEGRAPSPSGSRSFGGRFSPGPSDSVRNLVAETGLPRLELDEDDMEDLHYASEMARPGKPKLDKILADEVERSRGAIGVACCGPTSLNALVRKIVAAQINPTRVVKGDMRGMISLQTEEFQW